jgi:hypothetical protein
MKLAFYKATKGNLWDKLIGIWTRPNFFNPFKLGYSHVEIIYRDCLCFSSSPRDGGTRFKVINDLYTSGNWNIVDVKTYFNQEDIKVFCERQVGKKNDWLCIFFTFLIPFNFEEPNRWICSEIVGKFVFNLKRPSRYSPNKLFKYCKNNNLII